jgi:hypothetical protein
MIYDTPQDSQSLIFYIQNKSQLQKLVFVDDIQSLRFILTQWRRSQ